MLCDLGGDMGDAMKGRRRMGTLWAALALVGAGCHTMEFDVARERPVANTVYERKAFFLGGLVPTREVDLGDRCPHGVVAVREEQSFTDGLLSLLTLNIYTPRSSWYHCAAAEKTR